MKIKIFKENKERNISCGINENGDVFFAYHNSGYNLEDTPSARQKVLIDFEYFNRPAVRM